MANPNKTAGEFFRKRGSTPEARESRRARFEASDFARDMAAWQADEMSAEDFRRRHDPCFKD